mmetsp:Transcript_5465/g.15225  ORF Transcript_5465/g.15225 Transcript_5465/m.15225 type:complete len:258 (+) Transcript_5465:1398-2171(+)
MERFMRSMRALISSGSDMVYTVPSGLVILMLVTSWSVWRSLAPASSPSSSPSPSPSLGRLTNHRRSCRYAWSTKTTKPKSVIHASAMDTTPGVQMSRATNIHTYTSTDQMAVTTKTVMSEIALTSFPGKDTIQTAEIIRRLKAAEPTMVEGPSSPGGRPRVRMVSMMASMISGAEEPRAISVRLATVAFQTCAVITVPSFKVTVFSCAHISSTDDMKMSAMRATPKKMYARPRAYRKARAPEEKRLIPGMLTKLWLQ